MDWDWNEILAPLRTEIYHYLTLFFRDPLIVFAIPLTILGWIVTFINILRGKRGGWIFARLAALSFFCVFVSSVTCFFPPDKSWIFTRVQAIIGLVLITVSWALMLVIYKKSA